MQPDDQGKAPSWITVSPAIFFALSAFVYATGFLVILLFHDSYGLRALDDSFLKLKYAHVGILCLAIPVVALIACYSLFEFRTHSQKEFKKRLRYPILRVDNEAALASLAVKLKTPSDALSTFIQGRLSKDAIDRLSKWSGSGALSEPLTKTILDDLKQIIEGDLVYEENRFTGVGLRSETKQLLNAHESKKGMAGLFQIILDVLGIWVTQFRSDLAGLNRMLLEDGFAVKLSNTILTDVELTGIIWPFAKKKIIDRFDRKTFNTIESDVTRALKARLHPSLTITFAGMAAVIYIELIFTQPGEIPKWGHQLLLSSTMLWAFGMRAVAMHFESVRNYKWRLRMRRIQFLGVFILFGISCWQCRSELGDLCFPNAKRDLSGHGWYAFLWKYWPGGLWYLVLPILLGFLVSRIRTRVSETKIDEGRRLWLVFCVCMLGVFYFFTVSVFGYGVYHYVPAGKGGGDFSSVALIQINTSRVLPDVLTTNNPTRQLVLIEGTSSSIFVASPADNFGPKNWRRGRHSRPQVIEIPRSAIESINYTGETYSDWIARTNRVSTPQRTNTVSTAVSLPETKPERSSD